MSLHFWVVIKLLDELINRYTFGMWSYYDSVICQNTSGMLSHHRQRYPRIWSCCRIHHYVSTDVRCDPTVCFTDTSVHLWCDFTVCFTDLSIHFWVWSYCEIHWYVSTLGGCDHTVGFTDTSLPFLDVILLCDSLVCWYTSTILHSIASQKTAVSIVVNVGA